MQGSYLACNNFLPTGCAVAKFGFLKKIETFGFLGKNKYWKHSEHKMT